MKEKPSEKELLFKNNVDSARVVNPWNDLDEKTVTVDTVEKFMIQLSEFGY